MHSFRKPVTLAEDRIPLEYPEPMQEQYEGKRTLSSSEKIGRDPNPPSTNVYTDSNSNSDSDSTAAIVGVVSEFSL